MTSRKRQLAWCLMLSATACGCTSLRPEWLKLPEPTVPDVRPIREERADKAIHEFNERRSRALLMAAEASQRQSDFETCNDTIDKVLAIDPNHREALLLQAEVALETDRANDAVAGLRRAAAAWPKDAEVSYQLGVALDAAGKLPEALPYLREAAELSPRNEEYADALAQATEELGVTATVATPAVATPTTVETRPQAATPSPAAAPSKAPALLPVVAVSVEQEFAAAMTSWEGGRSDDCAVQVARVLRQQPNHLDGNILQAEIDLAAGRSREAVERMDRLVVRFPRNARIRRAAALVNESAQDPQKAALYYGEAQLLDEHETVVLASYAEPVVASRPAAKNPTSTSKLQQPASMVVVSDDLVAPIEPIARGEAALADGRVDEARRLLTEAVGKDRDNPQTALTAAVAALQSDQPELSYDLATAGTTTFPDSVALHRTRGMAAYRLGRYSDAEKALRRALSLDNSHPLTYFLLGSTLNRLGNSESGERYLREAARLDARYALRT